MLKAELNVFYLNKLNIAQSSAEFNECQRAVPGKELCTKAEWLQDCKMIFLFHLL